MPFGGEIRAERIESPSQTPEIDLNKRDAADKLLSALFSGERNLKKPEIPQDEKPMGRGDFQSRYEFLVSKLQDSIKPENCNESPTSLITETTVRPEEDTPESDEAGATDSNETDEPTKSEISEKQRAAIKEAFERLARGEELTVQEKGNLCEMMMDQYYISKGYTPLHDQITSLDDKGHQGIDGVYERKNEDGSKEYVIADAKFNTADLGTTVDGTRQMSDEWIDARLADAVGPEKAFEIQEAYEDNPDSVKHEVYHYDPNADASGYTHSDVSSVNPDGHKKHDHTVVETYDPHGTVIDSAQRFISGGRNDDA